jgi:hypothetical protein
MENEKLKILIELYNESNEFIGRKREKSDK